LPMGGSALPSHPTHDEYWNSCWVVSSLT
jgi:hypothetical protein